MDKPLDPRTPFREVYQYFLAILAAHFREQSTLDKYRYDFERFERWLTESGRSTTVASLIDTPTLLDYRRHLEALPQQARGSIRRRRGGMMSNQTVHSYLRSTKGLASWLTLNGYIAIHPFLATDPFFKNEGVMPVLRQQERILKIARPSDVQYLLRGCAGNEPEDLRDRAMIWAIYSSGMRADDVVSLPTTHVDFATGILAIEDGKGDKDREAFVQDLAAGYLRAYLKRGRTPLLERMPRRHGPVPAGGSNLVQTDLIFLSSRGRKGEIGITESGVLQMMTRRYAKGGGTDLTSFGPHRLRHGMATYLAEHGVDRAEIQRWGG
jgi:site-specific recombinase XerD